MTARDERRQRIIGVARDLFLTHGYTATSMSQVAAAVGGSKTTLWSYFRSKQDLFIAVADELIAHYFDPIEDLLDEAQEFRTTLERVGRVALDAGLSPTVTALIRIVTAEAGRFPELGRLFHERGLGRGWTLLAAFMERARAAGFLRPACDCAVAARQFLALCQSHAYQQVMMGGAASPSPATIEADVSAAVDTFLRAFAPAR